MPTTLIWHRHDLRLEDNSLYHGAGADGTSRALLGVFIFDPSQFARKPSCAQPDYDVTRTGPHAAALLLKAVADLRTKLRSHGGELLVRQGDPASVLPVLARQIKSVDEVCWHEEPGSEEVAVSKRVRSALQRARCRVTVELGCTLYHVEDLPRADQWAALAHPRQKMRSRKQSRRGAAADDECEVSSSVLAGGGSKSWRQRLSSMPRVMGDWRRAVRASTSPRPSLPAFTWKALLPCGLPDEIEAGDLPTIDELMAPAMDGGQTGRLLFGLPDEDIRSFITDAIAFHTDPPESSVLAGEAAARERLEHFVGAGHAGTADRSLADTGTDGSSKLSVPLALGCVSPRQVVEAASRQQDDSASWLISHMEMRDFFIYSAFAAGERLFARDGWLPVQKPPARASVTANDPGGGSKRAKDSKVAKGNVDGAAAADALSDPVPAGWLTPGDKPDAWRRWATGRTGLPLPDAGMREMIQTGLCSNRVRQNAASVLSKDLHIDWRAGAEWFQWCLADHEVSANWGNWAYFAGVGSDPKQRHFRTISQAAKYDADGVYVRKWLPELASVAPDEAEALLRPHAHGVNGWPEPVVDPESQLTWQDAERLSTTGRLVQVSSATI